MRKVIVGAMISIDGVMQAPGGSEEDPTGDFKFGGWTATLGETRFSANSSTSCSAGRSTYCSGGAPTISSPHTGPTPKAEPSDDIAKTFNRVTKYVATRKGVDLTWKGSVALHDAAKDVAKLKTGRRPRPRHPRQHGARACFARRRPR